MSFDFDGIVVVKVSVSFFFDPNSQDFTAKITLGLPCGSDGYIYPVLRDPSIGICNEPLTEHWGIYDERLGSRLACILIHASTLPSLNREIDDQLLGYQKTLDEVIADNRAKLESVRSIDRDWFWEF